MSATVPSTTGVSAAVLSAENKSNGEEIFQFADVAKNGTKNISISPSTPLPSVASNSALVCLSDASLISFPTGPAIVGSATGSTPPIVNKMSMGMSR